jgi:hypothetical protein
MGDRRFKITYLFDQVGNLSQRQDGNAARQIAPKAGLNALS